MTLFLLGVPAFATPATGDNTCVNAPPSTKEACECVFKSDAPDWENYADELNPDGTCYEFTAIVNSVPNLNREQALQRMTQVGNYMACYSDREFSRIVSWATGFPWVTSQLLDTMEEGECGVGAGIGVLRDIWKEGDDWMIGGEKGDRVLVVSWDRNYPDARLQRAWEIDDDGDERIDDMVLYWDDGRIWVALDYATIERLDPPVDDGDDKDDDRQDDEKR